MRMGKLIMTMIILTMTWIITRQRALGRRTQVSWRAIYFRRKQTNNRKEGNIWHTDITFSGNPPTGTVLYSRIIPPSGGDTLWASGTAVYDSLPQHLRAYLETLEATHSFEHSGWPNYFAQLENGQELYRQARADHLPVVHPVIRKHPITGKKIVYVNPNFTDRIKGLSRQQSDALLLIR